MTKGRRFQDMIADVALTEADERARGRVSEEKAKHGGRMPTADQAAGDNGDDDLVQPPMNSG